MPGCLTSSSFVSDQSFESNLRSLVESTKLKPMSNLPVDHLMLPMVYTAFDVV